MTLAFESYLDACAEELERTVDALEASETEVPVPTCPGWTATDLSEHLRRVYAHWRDRLAEGGTRVLNRSDHPSPAAAPGPGGEAAVPRRSGRLACEGLYEEGSRLLAELTAAGPEASCWNWTGVDQTGAWLARRIALETAVHRVDSELCAGAARPVEAELAADGIEERIEVYLRHDLEGSRDATLGGTLCLVCSDLDAAVVVEVAGGRLRWRRGRGPADAALVGTASQLFLFSWNRFPLDELSLTGRRDVALSWSALPGRGSGAQG